jgi:chromosome segregation ATPase
LEAAKTFNENVQELENQKSSLEMQIANLTSQKTKIEQQLLSYNTEIASTENTLKTLKADSDELDHLITKVARRNEINGFTMHPISQELRLKFFELLNEKLQILEKERQHLKVSIISN